MRTDPFPRRFLLAHARRRAGWEAVDLYKLLHQATRGSEHAAPGAAAAAAQLEREWAGLRPGPEEPLVEPIRADGTLARVNLRPWQETGLPAAVLLSAFLTTAETWQEVPGELGAALREAVVWALDLGLAPTDVAGVAAQMEQAGYPAVSHSAAYRLLYRPAYRVVAPRFLPVGLAGDDGGPTGA